VDRQPPARRARRPPDAPRHIPRAEDRLAEGEEDFRTGGVARVETSERAIGNRGGGQQVVAVESPAGGHGQPRSRVGGEGASVTVEGTEAAQVRLRLLEVVADRLVVVRLAAGLGDEPRRGALVEPGP
jgi:hypothetical protein